MSAPRLDEQRIAAARLCGAIRFAYRAPALFASRVAAPGSGTSPVAVRCQRQAGRTSGARAAPAVVSTTPGGERSVHRIQPRALDTHAPGPAVPPPAAG